MQPPTTRYRRAAAPSPSTRSSISFSDDIQSTSSESDPTSDTLSPPPPPPPPKTTSRLKPGSVEILRKTTTHDNNDNFQDSEDSSFEGEDEDSNFDVEDKDNDKDNKKLQPLANNTSPFYKTKKTQAFAILLFLLINFLLFAPVSASTFSESEEPIRKTITRTIYPETESTTLTVPFAIHGLSLHPITKFHTYPPALFNHFVPIQTPGTFAMSPNFEIPEPFKGHAVHYPSTASTSGGKGKSPALLEVYLDYTCPFSAKLHRTLFREVLPSYKPRGRALTVLFRQQVQPWHSQSTLVHEAALAVEKLFSEGKVHGVPSFFKFSEILMERQKEFFDLNVKEETRFQTQSRLINLALSLVKKASDKPSIEAALWDLLKLAEPENGELNAGNGVTGVLKQHVREGRGKGVHVSPTVFLDGKEREEVSSGWSKEKWEEWFDEVLA